METTSTNKRAQAYSIESLREWVYCQGDFAIAADQSHERIQAAKNFQIEAENAQLRAALKAAL